MKYISLDIETTGLDPRFHQVLQVAMVFDDLENMDVPIDELPYINLKVIHPNYSGSPVAMEMNRDLINELRAHTRETMPVAHIAIEFFRMSGQVSAFVRPEMVLKVMNDCCRGENITFAGKNIGSFDLQFLKAIDPDHKLWQRRIRCADPAILYTEIGDQHVPDLKTCLLRAGIKKEIAHDALEDARDVVLLMRQHFLNK